MTVESELTSYEESEVVPTEVVICADWSEFDHDPFTRQIRRNGIFHSTLSKKENKAFIPFVAHPNELITHEEIMKAIAENDYSENYPRTMVGKIRDKISDDPLEAKKILATVLGEGFVLVDRSRPREIVKPKSGYRDYHLRIKESVADKTEQVLATFQESLELRELSIGVALVLQATEGATIKGKKVVSYSELPDIEVFPVIDLVGIKFDPNFAQITVDGKKVHLTPTEARLLYILMKNPDKLVRKDIALSYLEEGRLEPDADGLKVFLSSLREKLAQGRENFESPIVTIRGKGLMFVTKK